jgi:hypothetical protein
MLSSMIIAPIFAVTFAAAASESPPPAATPPGWEVTIARDHGLTWAAPRGWKLSQELPAGAPPSSLAFAPRGHTEGWLTVEALVSGSGTAEEILARRPEGFTRLTTEDGWTCGEEPGTAAGVACARSTGLVTLLVELGGDPTRTVSRVGGVAALRKAAAFIQGVWPRGLPRPDPAGRLPAAEWVEWTANDGRVTWTMPRGWTRADGVPGSNDAPPTTMSFRASAGTGGLSITAGPGLAAAAPARLPVAEEQVIKLLVPGAALTRADGWSCGEGIEASTGLPAVTCAHITATQSLYVSVRAERAVFQTLGGVAAVRAAALRVRGLGQ